MAVEITPVVGCATCAAPLCRACLGCTACRTYSKGCLCPSVEYSAERVAARQAWLDAGRMLGQHIDDCFPCSLAWATDCDQGKALRAAVDAAWARYEVAS